MEAKGITAKAGNEIYNALKTFRDKLYQANMLDVSANVKNAIKGTNAQAAFERARKNVQESIDNETQALLVRLDQAVKNISTQYKAFDNASTAFNSVKKS